MSLSVKNEESGIVISFISILVALVVNVVLLTVTIPEQYPSFEYPWWLLALIAYLLFRHHLRILFIDSSLSHHMLVPYRRLALILLIPLAIIAGTALTMFSIVVSWGTVCMIIYLSLFLTFWISVLLSWKPYMYTDDVPSKLVNRRLASEMEESEHDEPDIDKDKIIKDINYELRNLYTNSWSGIFGELSGIVLWYFIYAKLGTGSLDVNRETGIVAFLCTVFISWEIRGLYLDILRRRISACRRIILNTILGR